ncbi:MAG: hypothetical protein AAF297_09360 [Planctomycetota bacterium]
MSRPVKANWRDCRIDLIPEGTFPRVIITDDPPPPSTPELEEHIDQLWQHKRAANPRLFDAPVLAYVNDDPTTHTITARRDTYKNLAVQPDLPRHAQPALTQLSLTAVLLAPDHQGEPHVFLGKRSPDTRIYGDLWELGPAGGIDCPPISQPELDHIDLWANLRNEITEELGLNVALPVGGAPTGLGATRSITPIALAHDPFAHSVDIVYRVELTTPVEDLTNAADPHTTRASWEYPATRWIPTAQLAAFDDTETDAIIPPTRALLRRLGWA